MRIFTQMCPPIVTKASPPCTSCTKMQRRDSMEKEYDAKKREYGENVREAEHAVFTPLVLLTCGGMSSETTTYYKKLAVDQKTLVQRGARVAEMQNLI